MRVDLGLSRDDASPARRYRLELQGSGLGRAIVQRLVALSRGHRKIILYAVPGREGFYRQFGFRRMATAMAIFEHPDQAQQNGYLLSDD